MLEALFETVFTVPGLLLILGAPVVPLLPAGVRSYIMLPLIGLSASMVWLVMPGIHLTGTLAGIDLILLRANELTLTFAVVFHIAAALNVIYAMHEDNETTATAGLAYAGAAIAALYAGDFVTLFLYWELTAVTSVFLVLAGNSARSVSAAMRYLLMQVGSGVLLLGGAALLWRSGLGLTIGPLEALSPAGIFILVALGIKAAFPLLGGWLQDAYPEASPTGSVMLSAFTTKLAIYMLACCFAGFTPLIYVGLAMAVISLFAAIIENNLRRVLAIALVNQLGFMVVGIGIGTELALNGVAAHAFASVLYKGLLFMSIGAVFMRIGSDRASDLGGLAKHMPLTAAFCIIGALSIASVPILSGFTTKSLTLGAVAKSGEFWVWLGLMFATVGVILHTAIKLPYAAFFAPNTDITADEAPLNMLIAMAVAAAGCVLIGLYPTALYDILPYPVTYEVWKLGYVMSKLQLLVFAGLAFVLLQARGFYPLHGAHTVIYTDWITRSAIPHIAVEFGMPILAFWQRVKNRFIVVMLRLLQASEQASRESGLVSGIASTGAAAALFLAVFALMLLIRLLM